MAGRYPLFSNMHHDPHVRCFTLGLQPAVGREPQLAFLGPLTRLTRLALAGDFAVSPSAYAAINNLGGQLRALDLRGKASHAVELRRLSGLVGLQELDCSQCSVALAPEGSGGESTREFIVEVAASRAVHAVLQCSS